MVEQPSGTVTLVFTDIEGSTRLLQELGRDAYLRALAEHRRIVRDAFAAHGGYEVDYEGDAFFYAFASAVSAVAAVEQAVRELETGPIRVRAGIHTGEPGLDPPKYVGLDVHRAARIAAAGHGGQVLVSQATRDVVGTDRLRDLGDHRLADLPQRERIFQLGERKFPPLNSLSRTNLPAVTGPLFGREAELEAIGDLLARGVRLVTLTGAGGSGKTRLALQAARNLVDEFSGGVFFVGLAPLSDVELVAGAVAQVLDLAADEDLRERLGRDRVLLVLDNVEHLAEIDQAVAQLLVGEVVVLATGRAPLHLEAEHEVPVEPLSDVAAAELFVTRAAAVGSRIEPDQTVGVLCRRLDNLPLALELAAARTKHLAAAAVLERLDRALPILTGGPRDVPQRQQSLRAAIEWSHDLLDDDDRVTFRRLSVFRGAYTLDAAEAICDADLDRLAALVDQSLLKTAGGDRFEMLETIREYALERLEAAGEQDEIMRRHASWYAQLVELAEPEIEHGVQEQWLARLDAEQANIRTALEWALEGAPVEASRIAAAAAHYWLIRGHLVEGNAWFEATLARERDPLRRMRLLRATGMAAVQVRDADALRAASAERLELARAADEHEHIAGALNYLGVAAAADDDHAQAAVFFASAADAAQNARTRASATGNLGIALAALGDDEQARICFAQAIEEGERLGNEEIVVVFLQRLAEAELVAGRVDAALSAGRRALERAHRLRDTPELGFAFNAVAAALGARGDAERAASIQGAADDLLARAQTRHWGTSAIEAMYEASRSHARQVLGDERYDTLYEHGAHLGLDDAVTLALQQ